MINHIANNRSELYSSARKLRLEAKTFRQIAAELGLPLSTVHLWTKDISLSVAQQEQIQKIHFNKFIAARIEKAHQAKVVRKEIEAGIFSSAKRQLPELSKDSFFLMGLGLYWAEGFKKDHSLGFVNSDPEMIKYFLEWLYKYGNVDPSVVRVRVQINKLYKERINRVESYWAEVLDISMNQFQKPFFLESRKNTELNDNYHGLVRIRAIGTRKLFVQIQGWLQGFKEFLRKDGIISHMSG